MVGKGQGSKPEPPSRQALRKVTGVLERNSPSGPTRCTPWPNGPGRCQLSTATQRVSLTAGICAPTLEGKPLHNVVDDTTSGMLCSAMSRWIRRHLNRTLRRPKVQST